MYKSSIQLSLDRWSTGKNEMSRRLWEFKAEPRLWKVFSLKLISIISGAAIFKPTTHKAFATDLNSTLLGSGYKHRTKEKHPQKLTFSIYRVIDIPTFLKHQRERSKTVKFRKGKPINTCFLSCLGIWECSWLNVCGWDQQAAFSMNNWLTSKAILHHKWIWPTGKKSYSQSRDNQSWSAKCWDWNCFCFMSNPLKSHLEESCRHLMFLGHKYDAWSIPRTQKTM